MRINFYANGQNTKQQKKGKRRISSFNNRDEYCNYYYYKSLTNPTRRNCEKGCQNDFHTTFMKKLG